MGCKSQDWRGKSPQYSKARGEEYAGTRDNHKGNWKSTAIVILKSWINVTTMYYDYQLSKAPCEFCHKVLNLKLALSRATFLIAISSIACHIAYNFVYFVANDVKDWQVSTRNRASSPWQQQNFHVKTRWPNFCCALFNW